MIFELSFIPIWRATVYRYFLRGIIPKELIVNVDDLVIYERELAKLYPDGIIPTVGGCLKFKSVPLSISDQLGRNECRVVE